MLCAIAAVARKLAGILYRMWVSETDFRVGFGANATAGAKAGAVTARQEGAWDYSQHMGREEN